MKKILILNKKEGETPLEALENFRRKHPKYRNIKMTYAGRLDPMASGLLIVLAGEECKNKEKYLVLDKEYEFSVLFGFSTDSYDILGKVLPHRIILWGSRSEDKDSFKKLLKEKIKYFIGKYKQEYPLYSGKTVKGKKLFEYGREDKKVKLPNIQINVKYLKFVKIKSVSAPKLLLNIEHGVKKVRGNFRQKEILKTWHHALTSEQGLPLLRFYIGDFKVKCSSGTYVRGIADSLGKKIGIPALAYSIKRTKIGKYSKIII